jgi:hypothetical protein
MPTPSDMILQLETLIQQWKNPPTAQSRPLLTTADQIRGACASGGVYDLAPGTYAVNLEIRAPLSFYGPRDAVLVPADPLQPAVFVMASDVILSGFTITGGAQDRECLVVGDVYATDAAVQPSRVLLDDLVVMGGEHGGHRGIALHGAHLTVQACEILNWWEVGRDSQGIWINNGPGPYTITDNTIEASGENILVGGADPRIPNCVPSDILIARNTLLKPEVYAMLGARNVNALELKNARRAQIEDNEIDNRVPIQHASLIQFTPRNQDGTAPWSTVEDVEFRRNLVRSTVPIAFAVNILGTDNERRPDGTVKTSQQTARITIAGNLFDAAGGFQVLGGVAGHLIIDHNTLPCIVTKLFSFDKVLGQNVMSPLTFTNNVARGGQYPITGDGNQAFGTPSLIAFATVAAWSGNVIEDGAGWSWPAGQSVLAKDELAALLDPTTYKLLSGTAGYGQ